MTTTSSGAPSAPAYTHAVDFDALPPRFDMLIDELLTHLFSDGALNKALSGTASEMAAILRAIPIQEGRMLERGIALIAGLDPDLEVLTQNLRLPITKTAIELVALNDPTLYRSLTLDADSGGRKSFTPDLILVNRKTQLAHVVDVKRSLGSYEVSRINDLKSRMLAAALVVPDFLYKEHHRLPVKDVLVVIINAENQRADFDGGVWPLSHLDHLVEVAGAGRAIGMLRERFHSRIEECWKQAREAFAAPKGEAACHGLQPEPAVSDESDGQGVVPFDRAARSHIRIGFARMPRSDAG